jgi:peptidoglycan/xylan/chitin deacetylase (PgdA/CDA1 family)
MNILHDCIPTIAYHQVSSNNKITPQIFEEQMHYLYENGFKTVSLDEFYFYIAGGKDKRRIEKKKILITFDDGFADNFIHAYPILKRYGFCAVVFLITSRVTDSRSIRFNIDDLGSGLCEKDELYETNVSRKANIDSVAYGKTDDFLTAGEIKNMFDDRVMDFQSHTHLHAKYYSDNKIVDFFNPDTRWPVLFETSGRFDYGIPVYNMRSAVYGKRFFDDKSLREFLIEYVNKNGGVDIFKNKNYKKILFKVVDDYKAKCGLVESYESDRDYEERVASDLMRSKDVIEKILNKKAEYLCWPWGEFSKSALDIAKKCGFKGIFSLKRGANKPGSDVYNLKRLEVKAKGLKWFEKRVSTYSSSLKAGIYEMIRL